MKGKINISRILNIGFVKFSFSGGAVLLLTLIFTFILTEVIHLHYMISYLIVLMMVTIINYFLATKYIFLTKEKHPKRFFYYIFGLILFYLGDILFTRFLTEILVIYYLISIFISRTFFFLTKFFYYKKVLFNDSSFFYLKK